MDLQRHCDVIMFGGDQHCQALEASQGKPVADGEVLHKSKGKLPIVEA